MAGSVNKVISMYLDDMMSIPMISAALSVPKSRVRKMLIDADVEMRSFNEAAAVMPRGMA